jgi:hypothetical protein
MIARDMVVWYAEGSPFESPLLSSPAFLALLRPLVRSLRLSESDVVIDPRHFAAICELSGLEELSIQGAIGNEDVCYPSYPCL